MKTVLIVDDNPENLYFLEVMLKGNGFDVIAASNGLEAWESAIQNPPDLIISDILMPVMDGFNLCRKCKADNTLKDIPFIFYTATFTTPKDEKFALSLGAEKFIVKPQEPEVLMNMLSVYLGEGHDKGLAMPASPGEELEFFRQHNEILFKKLEKKILDLEIANQNLKLMEEKYHALLEHSADAIIIVSPDLRFIEINRKAETLLGYDRAELPGLAISLIFPEAELDKTLNAFNEIIEGRTCRLTETGILRKDRITVPVDITGTVIEYRGKKLVQAILRDIAARKESEQELTESEERYRVAIEASNDGVALIRDGCHIYVNRKFLEIYGYDRPEDALGKNISLTVHPDDREMVVERNRKRQSGEDIPSKYEFKGIRKDGTPIYIEVSVAAVTFHGKPATIAYHRDITERKLAEESLLKSEAKFSSIFHLNPDPIAISDVSTGKMIDVNRAFSRFSGYSREEIIGNTAGALNLWVNPEDRAAIIGRLIADGEVNDAEVEMRQKNGNVSIVLFSARLIEIDNIRYLLTLSRDITSRKKIESERNNDRQRFFALAENAPFGMLLIDNKDRFIYINQMFREIFGYDLEEIPDGKAWFAKLYPDRECRNAVISLWIEDLKASAPGQKRPRIHKVKCKNGKEKIINFIPVQLTTGETIMTCEDITDRRIAEERLQEAMSQLEEKNAVISKTYEELKESQKKIIQTEKMASIGQIAAGVAHEINNPMGFVISNLSSLQGYMERLHEFYDIEEAAFGKFAQSDKSGQEMIMEQMKARKSTLKIDYIRNDIPGLIRESLDGANRVKKIVEDLKSFSRIDDESHTIADIHSVLEATLNIVWNELKYKATLNREYGEVPPIKCNPGQLSQVFMNILVNAAHAINGYGAITIRTSHDKENIFVAISDTGSGIPEEHIKKLFEPFFTTKETGKGTGLGLSISYDIVRKHNGEILVDTEFGRGTTMTVKLPLQGVVNES